MSNKKTELVDTGLKYSKEYAIVHGERKVCHEFIEDFPTFP